MCVILATYAQGQSTFVQYDTIQARALIENPTGAVWYAIETKTIKVKFAGVLTTKRNKVTCYASTDNVVPFERILAIQYDKRTKQVTYFNPYRWIADFPRTMESGVRTKTKETKAKTVLIKRNFYAAI